MKIYQGEALTFTMEVISGEEENETMDKYIPRAVLVPELGYVRDCCPPYPECDCRCGDGYLRWNDIAVIDGIAVFEMTSEQSAHLNVGIYTLEVALRDKNNEADIKGQVRKLIEVFPSYTLK